MIYNDELERRVQVAIDTEPLLSGCSLKVSISGDVAIITGSIDNFQKKSIVKNLVHAIPGVSEVIRTIEVFPQTDYDSDDKEIQSQILEILAKNLGEASDALEITVKNGVVELQGILKWNYQKDLAADSISAIIGIKDIRNFISVPQCSDENLLKNKILKTISIISTEKIEVLVSGSAVTLIGCVKTEKEKETIAKVVEMCPGVDHLSDKMHLNKNPHL